MYMTRHFVKYLTRRVRLIEETRKNPQNVVLNDCRDYRGYRYDFFKQ